MLANLLRRASKQSSGSVQAASFSAPPNVTGFSSFLGSHPGRRENYSFDKWILLCHTPLGSTSRSDGHALALQAGPLGPLDLWDMPTQLHAIVCGGSIGGLVAAHALLKAGWHVSVYEQATAIVPAGAGLSLDESSAASLDSLALRQSFESNSLPNFTEHHCAVRDGELVVLFRNPRLGYRSTHWSLLHKLLLEELPTRCAVHFGHKVVSVLQSQGSSKVTATVRFTAHGGQQREVRKDADLLVAVDGSMSRIRARFAPNEVRRYAGYSAWRGVLHAAEVPEVMQQLRTEFPELGRGMYIILEKHGHAVLYEVPDRINWMWYRNGPEPALMGTSVTYQPSAKEVADLKRDAASTWTPALSGLMQATPKPFVNAIFDREPLETFVYGRTVLLGEAAHPTTPHAGRSTNMAISDAACLGQALASNKDIDAALQAYDAARVPVTCKAVLFSRWMGQLKQGWLHGNNYNWLDSADADALLKQTPQLNALNFDPAKYRFATISFAQDRSLL